MPLIANNTNPVSFHISMCWYLTIFTSENLQVLQSDPSCFQQPLDEILSRIDFQKYCFLSGIGLLNSVICVFGNRLENKDFTHH